MSFIIHPPLVNKILGVKLAPISKNRLEYYSRCFSELARMQNATTAHLDQWGNNDDGRGTRICKSMLDVLAMPIKDKIVIDFGAGDFTISKALADAGAAAVYAVDIKEPQDKDLGPRIKYIQIKNDFSVIPAADFIFCSHVLHHVSDLNFVIGELAKKAPIIVLREHDVVNESQRSTVVTEHCIYDIRFEIASEIQNISKIKSVVKKYIVAPSSGEYKSAKEWAALFAKHEFNQIAASPPRGLNFTYIAIFKIQNPQAST